MRNLISCFIAYCLLLPLFTKAGIETEKSVPPYTITKTSTDKTLKKNEVLFVFSFCEEGGKKINQTIQFSCDGKNRDIKPDAKGIFKLKEKPGKHIFQFFYSASFEEIYTDSIPIKGSTRMEILLSFQHAGMPAVADKPVIYLYPGKTQEVSVVLKPKGNFTFTYPAYNNGWKCIASPDGSLAFGEKKYGYLFWEGTIQLSKADINTNEGYVVAKDSLVNFLENKLYTMGLNAKEVQDFITYWYPRMSANEHNFVQFMFNETYNQYAAIDVNPKPDQLFRVFMVWSKAESGAAAFIKPQAIPSFKRSGFTVVEWGGTEVETIHP